MFCNFINNFTKDSLCSKIYIIFGGYKYLSIIQTTHIITLNKMPVRSAVYKIKDHGKCLELTSTRNLYLCLPCT